MTKACEAVIKHRSHSRGTNTEEGFLGISRAARLLSAKQSKWKAEIVTHRIHSLSTSDLERLLCTCICRYRCISMAVHMLLAS